MKRRTLEERIRTFSPTEPPDNDQLGFIMSPAKIRGVFGGNRSGKTEVGVADAIMFATGTHPIRSAIRKPPVYIRYCAPKWEDNIKAVIVKKFQQMVRRVDLLGGSWVTAWSEKARTLHFANGSIIRFFTYEQDVNVYGGDDIDAFYMDEHGAEKYYVENIARTIDRNGYGVLTMTPEAGITWEEDKIVVASERDKNIEFWHFTTYNNPHLSKEGIAELEKAITDDALREAKLLGRFVALSGLVYPQYNPNVHFIPDRDIPKEWPRTFAIDPHHRKDTAMLWGAWSPDGEVFFYRESKFSPRAGGVPELAAHIRAKSAGDKIQLWIGDEAMGGDGLNIFGEKTVIEQLRAQGIPIQGTNQASDKTFEAGIFKIREMLTPDAVSGKPRIYVMRSCPMLNKEFLRYQYKEETKADEQTFREQVRKVGDDLLDDARYIVMSGPRDSEPIRVNNSSYRSDVDSFTGV